MYGDRLVMRDGLGFNVCVVPTSRTGLDFGRECRGETGTRSSLQRMGVTLRSSGHLRHPLRAALTFLVTLPLISDLRTSRTLVIFLVTFGLFPSILVFPLVRSALSVTCQCRYSPDIHSVDTDRRSLTCLRRSSSAPTSDRSYSRS